MCKVHEKTYSLGLKIVSEHIPCVVMTKRSQTCAPFRNKNSLNKIFSDLAYLYGQLPVNMAETLEL